MRRRRPNGSRASKTSSMKLSSAPPPSSDPELSAPYVTRATAEAAALSPVSEAAHPHPEQPLFFSASNTSGQFSRQDSCREPQYHAPGVARTRDMLLRRQPVKQASGLSHLVPEPSSRLLQQPVFSSLSSRSFSRHRRRLSAAAYSVVRERRAGKA